MHHSTDVFPRTLVQITGQDLVSHAGVKPLASFMDALGIKSLGENHLGQFVPDGARHGPGAMIASLMAMLAAGGEHVSDLDMLRTSPKAFGTIPSNATISRFFDHVAGNREVFAHGLATMASQTRRRVWDTLGGLGPGRVYTPREPLIIDMDHTLVTAHSEKEQAMGNYKGGYGYAPFVAAIDYGDAYGGEVLACHLRPGNAGANEAAAHIALFDEAVAGLPAEFFDEGGHLIGSKILVRADSAGASREFLNHLDALGVQFSVSYAIPVVKDTLVHRITDKRHWQPALDQDGYERKDAWVVNATEAIGLKDYPVGTNLYLRAEPLHPGARATLLDHEGMRITAFLCNSPRWDAQGLDARHRRRARCENRIKTLKNTGLGKLPFKSFAANQAWASLAALAMNMLTWMTLTAVPSGHDAASWDVKRWRYRVFATAGKVITRARRRVLLLPETAPETTLITRIISRIAELRTLLAPPVRSLQPI